MGGVQSAWYRVRKFGEQFQVELQGHYSTERLRSLHNYGASTTILWAITTSLATPFPCLVVLTLIDAVPLAHWKDGLSANYTFWARDFFAIALMTRAILEQFRVAVPNLHMDSVQVLAMSVISSGGAIMFMIAMSSEIGFPLPFALVVGISVWFIVLIACFGSFYGAALRRNHDLFIELRDYTVVLVLQVLLTFIYPTYLYGFLSVRTDAQMFYFMLLPVIKLIARNWISVAMDSKCDLKPQIVVFNVEVFHGLYVAASTTNSASIITMLQTIAMDIVLGCVSLMDIYSLMEGVDQLMLKIPVDHPLKRTCFVEVALQVLEEDSRARDHLALRRFSSILMQGSKYRVAVKQNSRASQLGSGSRRIHPGARDANPGSTTTLTAVSEEEDQASASIDSKSLVGVFSPRERRAFVQRTAQLHFTTEFIILVEYAEVIVPFIYGMYTTSMFILPNRNYYPLLSELDEAGLASELEILAAISTIELLSFLVISLILQRKLGISVLKLLSFVLDRSRRMVQANLFLWICYTIQNSLDHNGADFSFQFSWLDLNTTSSAGSS